MSDPTGMDVAPTATRPTASLPTTQTERSSALAEVWRDEALASARSGRRIAWIVASVMIIICAGQAAAIAILTPLKEVVPYTVLVDRQTGYVEMARGVRLGDLDDEQAVIHSMLAQYVLARETFDPADFAERYARTALWSLGSARNDYVAQFRDGAASEALAGLRPGSLIRISVQTIDLISPDTAEVRFEAKRSETGGEAVRTLYRAIVAFRFTGAPMKMEDRLLNPLGFQVTSYRRDALAAPDTPGASPVQESVNVPLAPEPAIGIDINAKPAAGSPTPEEDARTP